jgi:hypothetical protein
LSRQLWGRSLFRRLQIPLRQLTRGAILQPRTIVVRLGHREYRKVASSGCWQCRQMLLGGLQKATCSGIPDGLLSPPVCASFLLDRFTFWVLGEDKLTYGRAGLIFRYAKRNSSRTYGRKPGSSEYSNRRFLPTCRDLMQLDMW